MYMLSLVQAVQAPVVVVLMVQAHKELTVAAQVVALHIRRCWLAQLDLGNSH